MTVTGFGFDYGTIDAKIDGVKCAVIKAEKEKFTCKVGPRAEVSATGVDTVGQFGLSRRRVDLRNWGELGRWKTYVEEGRKYKDYLITHFESPQGDGNYNVNLYRGWFLPPATTKYRFYTVCDDDCSLKLATAPNTSLEPVELLSVTKHTEARRYYRAEDG